MFLIQFIRDSRIFFFAISEIIYPILPIFKPINKSKYSAFSCVFHY